MLLAGAARANTDSPESGTVFVELVGSAPLASVNYEMHLKEHLYVCIGVGYLRATGFLGDVPDRVQVPLVVGVTRRPGAHLELGLGLVPGILTAADAKHRVERPATAVIGYRHRAPDGRFVFRASLAPLIDFWDGGVG